MAKAYIGTSGFSYSHWGDGVFYPKDLPQKDWFLYYTKHFDTVELNVSFYRLPRKEVFAGWRRKAGPPAGGFVFSIKGSRFITHIKKLKDCQEPVERFFEAANGVLKNAEVGWRLGESSNASVPPMAGYAPHQNQCGTSEDIASRQSSPRSSLNVVLWQLPPGWKINYPRLESFLKILPKTFRHAFELRNPTWLTGDVYRLLKKANAAVVFQDYPGWPITQEITTDFVYLRFHGRTSLYSSCYTEKELTGWADKIKAWQKKGLDCYAYFNNDSLGCAVENAQTLKKLC